MPSDSATFPVDVKAVTNSIRKAFADVLTSAGADPLDRRSIEERTGLSQTLSWKLSKIVAAEDTAVVLKQMPRRAGIKTFLDSVGKAGAKSNALAAAKQAISDYQQLIERHSGDRETLDMLGSAISPAGRRQQDEQHRKLAFQGNSYLWGAQARAVMRVQMFGPGAQPGLVNIASVDAIIDFRRLRPGVPWVVASRRTMSGDGGKLLDHHEEALDPRFLRADGPPLLGEFCSRPLPQIRLTNDEDPHSHIFETSADDSKLMTFELVEGPVGNTGAVTCVVGTAARNLPGLAYPGNESSVHIFSSGTPAECLVIDTFIHESSLRDGRLSVSMHGQVNFGRPWLGARTALSLAEPLQDIGRGAALPPTPEFKDHEAMVLWMYERMAWNPAEFHHFRLRIPYPICPSALVFSHPLPPP